jgi:hypothetical protein
MDDLVVWLCVAGWVITLIWGIDRHLNLKDVEISLKDYLGDLLVSRDSALSKTCECCAQSRVLELKTLIRKHFKL